MFERTEGIPRVTSKTTMTPRTSTTLVLMPPGALRVIEVTRLSRLLQFLNSGALDAVQAIRVMRGEVLQLIQAPTKLKIEVFELIQVMKLMYAYLAANLIQFPTSGTSEALALLRAPGTLRSIPSPHQHQN